jgi:hypothetical protein
VVFNCAELGKTRPFAKTRRFAAAFREIQMKKLVLETTAPFQGLPELVAYDEGLFEKEGLRIEWADREKGVEKKVEPQVTSPKGVNPFASHGKLFEQGKADMYNACEWGNYCRVQDTGTGSRQLGRRAIVACAALVVAPDCLSSPRSSSPARRSVPFYFGTHYVALHMGRLPAARDDQALPCPERLTLPADALMRGEVDATTLTEPPYHARREEGCRIICSASSMVPRSPRAGGCRNLCRVQSRVREPCAGSTPAARIRTTSSTTTPRTIRGRRTQVEDLRESRLVV